MSQAHTYLNRMPTVNGATIVEHRNALTGSIIDTIHTRFPEAVSQTKYIAESFKGATRLDTARNIWNFLRNQIQYVKDSSKKQRVKAPNRFLYDGTGDCKSFAFFTAGILKNLGMPTSFRYASYWDSDNPNKNIPTHIYTVTKDEMGNEIIIDAVYHLFDAEKTPAKKKILIQWMLSISQA